MEADKLLVADRLVGLQDAGRALDARAVTEAVRPAPVVLSALRPHIVAAVTVTAGALARGADRPPLEAARPLGGRELCPLGPAASLGAVIVPSTVALLTLFHDTITTNGNFRL